MGEVGVFYSSMCEQGGENPGRGSNVAGRDSLTLAESLMNGKPSLS